MKNRASSQFLIVFAVSHLVSPVKCDAKSGNFVSDVEYSSKVLNVPGLHFKGANELWCSVHCLFMANCSSFAINSSSAEKDCILYDTNLCDVNNNNVGIVTKDGYRLYDRVGLILEQGTESCYSFRQNRTDTDACTTVTKYFNYKVDGSGCPLGFKYDDSVCYRVFADKVLKYTPPKNGSTDDPIGSRLAKIRDKRALQFLSGLMSKSIAFIAFSGARNYGGSSNGTSDWRWPDGTPLLMPDPTGLQLFRPLEPGYEPEEYAVIQLPDHCWSDVHRDKIVNAVCQAPASVGKCPKIFPFKLNTKNQNCYALTNDAFRARNAIDLCRNISAANVFLRDYEEWQFVVEMMKSSAFTEERFSVGVENTSGTWIKTGDPKTLVTNFNQWCPGQPDRDREGCGVFYSTNKKDYQMQDRHCSIDLPQVKEFIATSCSEWSHVGQKSSGSYRILPRGAMIDFRVYCDMQSEGGGWTVISHQMRQGKNVVNSQRTFTDYRNGFGNLINDSWIGLDPMHLLTAQEDVELLLDLTDVNNKQHQIRYSKFQVYKLDNSTYTFSLRNFTSTDGLSDEFGKQQNSAFNVNDNSGGGWWYVSGSAVNLNGNSPLVGGVDKATVMQWSPDVILLSASMKIKSLYLTKCLNAP